MDRATKLLVVGWTCAALAAVIFFIQSGWPALPKYAAIAFVGMGAAAAVTPRAIAVPLLFTYVFPIIVRYQTGQNYAPYSAIWIAALLGALVPRALAGGWQMPARWRPAIAAWALTIVVGGTIVALREFDFTTALLYTKRVSNSSIGGWPAQTVAWCLYTAVVLLVGMLWFDWLCGLRREDVTRTAIVPLAISFAATLAVAVYQLLADVTFLNPTVYGATGRACGLLMDANVLGTCAALWIGGWMLIQPRARWRLVMTALGIGASWLAVWATGSRTGFAAALLVSAFAASAAVATYRTGPVQAARRGVLLAGSAGALIVVAFFLFGPTHAVGPLARIRGTITRFDRPSLVALTSELWNRNGYGAIASTMIRSAPLVGVGVGGFVIIHPDFFTMAGIPPLPPDNAQNWFKQQFVEFGALGSIPWAVWCVLFGLFVLRRRGGESPETRIPRGMLMAFAAISLVGVPAQNVVAAITFWLAAFWYVSLAPAPPEPAVRLNRRLGVGMLALLIAFGSITWWRATTTLRVPVRAQRVGWPYSYGVYGPEPDGRGGEQRWTAERGVIVVDAPTPHLLLTVTPNALAQRRTREPMRIRVDVDRDTVVNTDVTSIAPIVKYVRLAPEARVLVEARVNQTLRPSSIGLDDDRDLGVLMQWRFLAEAPAAGDAPSGSDR